MSGCFTKSLSCSSDQKQTEHDRFAPINYDGKPKEKSLHNLHTAREQNTTQTHTQKSVGNGQDWPLVASTRAKRRHTWRSTGGETFRFLFFTQLPFFILRNNHFFVLARIKAKSNRCCAGVHCSPVFFFFLLEISFIFLSFFTVANRFIRCSFT